MTKVAFAVAWTAMLRTIARVLLIGALCVSIGAHWIALQSVAWAAMIVQYSQSAPLIRAVAQAFDGQHPCSLCHAVQMGKKSEKKTDVQSVPKLDFCCVSSETARIYPFRYFAYPLSVTPLIARTDSPLTPPPRSMFA